MALISKPAKIEPESEEMKHTNIIKAMMEYIDSHLLKEMCDRTMK
jgi:hypothetical protein